ncbi:hypothetical protein F2Q70_00029371 [Brassica cretica]|nr:hypothetical protein F2Q70_00029371 [Brassica cretica]
MTHEEFTAKHPHQPSLVYVKIDRHQEPVIDRQPPAPIDRRAPITYRVQMPKIDVARLNALRPKPKPLENPPEAFSTPSNDGIDSMEIDKVPTGRTLRKRKEKVAKHLKRETTSRRINDPGIIAACHCGAEYETEYLASIETHAATSINSAHQISTDTPKEESVNSSSEDWGNDCYNPIMAVNDTPPDSSPEDLYDEEYKKKGILVYKFHPLRPEIQAQVETDSLLAEAYGK